MAKELDNHRKALEWFEGKNDELKSIVASLQRYEFEAREEVIRKNASEGHIAYIHHGIVKKVGRISPRLGSDAKTLSFHGPGEIIAGESLCLFSNPLGYLAASHCEVSYIPTASLILPKNSVFRDIIAIDALIRLKQLEWMKTISSRDNRTRVLSFLWTLRRLVKDVEIPFSLQDVADICQTGKSRTGVILKEFETKGLLTRGRGHYLLAETQELFAELKKVMAEDNRSTGVHD